MIFQGGAGRKSRRRQSSDHDPRPIGQTFETGSHQVSQAPFDQVSVDRRADRLAHHKTDGLLAPGSWKHMRDESRLRPLRPTADRFLEVLTVAHTKFAREHESGRQLGATLAATIPQDRAAGTGAHAKTEAVLFGATTVVRLKSTLAHNSSLNTGQSHDLRSVRRPPVTHNQVEIASIRR